MKLKKVISYSLALKPNELEVLKMALETAIQTNKMGINNDEVAAKLHDAIYQMIYGD